MWSHETKNLAPGNYLRGDGEQSKPERYFSSLIILPLILFMFHFITPTASAQTIISTIEGTVTDTNGAVVAGATVKATGTTLAAERTSTSNAEGFYRLPALPAGSYTLTVSQSGFSTSTSKIELTLNQVVTFNVQLHVGTVGGDVVDITADTPLLNQDTPATGMTVTPRQIRDLPVNGRNYLDLLQLVPGVAVNRQADPEGDGANPVLGERSGNNNFFIDGHPNKDTVSGGAAAQFNQETIAEFQVLTTGYKAEFGQASGAIVNVITKSGGNGFHGVASFFHRNEAFDSVNSLDETVTDAPHLRRFDYSVAVGGPIIKDRVFFFGSAERITEDRQIDFKYPVVDPLVDPLIRDLESPFDVPSPSRETRVFFKLNEQLGRHSLSQEINYTNGFVRNFAPLSAGNSLPSTRTDRGARNLLLAFGDTMLLGDKADPWIVTLRGAYRGEPSDIRPAHPEVGGGNTLTVYPLPVTHPLQVPGPLPTVNFGRSLTASFLDQQYTALNANANKRFGDHDLKFGWSFLRTKVDGLEARQLTNQLFTTAPDFAAFDPVFSGISLLLEVGGATPEDDEIHLRNNYNALFVQDDWRIRNNLTISLGLRWDHDSEFEAKKNFAPRLGVTWGITPKTVVRAQLGVFYDQFRLGTARSVPPFGGANQLAKQDLLYPRGFYGSPNFISSAGLFILGSGPCVSNLSVLGGGNLTDAQIAGAGCPLAPSLPFVGVDRLNNVVAAGHAPIPANSVITIDNIQTLSGLTPDQYLTQANASIGFPGFFRWGAFGVLSNGIVPPFGAPNRLENIGETPNTLGFSVGVQHEIAKDMVVEADYHHREMRNILGLRDSSITFQARIPEFTFTFDPEGTQIIAFGPYYEGRYDALVVSFNKRFANRFLLGASYTYSNATDNTRGVDLPPSDSFIGMVPEVTEPSTGTSNRNGSFTAANGNFVPQAGTFWNGPDVDKGPSDLALDHIFQINGMVALPWQFQISGIFRAQSGFHHSKLFGGPGFIDPDGNAGTNSIDIRTATRNEFTAPPFVNLDLRFTKRFDIGERVKLDLFYEMFNVFNRQNPASINTQPEPNLFGTVQQVLPGREGQVGFRIEF